MVEAIEATSPIPLLAHATKAKAAMGYVNKTDMFDA
jgi:hypothetical protein